LRPGLCPQTPLTALPQTHSRLHGIGEGKREEGREGSGGYREREERGG